MPDLSQPVILSAAKNPSAFLVGRVASPRKAWRRQVRKPWRTRASAPHSASLRMTISRAASLPARAAGGLVWVYQQTVSPALAAVNPLCGCRFAPTCSHYAREALQVHGLFAGFVLTARRLVKCGPWHPGGLDPVPPRHAPVCTRVQAAPSFTVRP